MLPAAGHVARVRNYKRYKVWRKSHALLLNVHREIKRFPREYASLRSQIRRAAESVPTNIVEGCAFFSDKEFAKYLQFSVSSSNELEYWLRVARDYGLLAQRCWSNLTVDTQEVRKMLCGLLDALRRPPRYEPFDGSNDDRSHGSSAES